MRRGVRARYPACVADGILEITEEGPIRVVTIANPGSRNAVPTSGWDELRGAFEDFERSDRRVMVVTGAGGDFCSGAALDESMLDPGVTTAATTEFMRPPQAAALALHRITKPTVAAVDGVAAGAGMNLAIGCDIVLASDRARFSEIFVRRGLTMDFGGSWLLPRIVGLARARELALTGRMVDAREAAAIGLALEVVPADGLGERALEIARQLADGAPLAQRFLKRALDRSSGATFEQAIAMEATAQSILLASEDVREGVDAFLGKRPPRFQGR